MPLRIPPRHREPLKRLYELVAADARPLIELLEALPAFVPTPELSARIAALWPELDEDAVAELTLAMVSLATQLTSWSPDELGRLISESEDLDVPDEGRERFGAILSQLVATSVLETTAKAVNVMSQQERIFHDARIMSDIRPIFGDDPSERPDGAVVVHTLSIEYHADHRIQTFNVAIDRSDLDALKAAVDRAILKAATLSEVVERAGLALFELEEAEGE